MAEVLGRGTIEIVADARKLRAGIEDAKKSLRTLGEGQKDISKKASASIDNYVGKLQQQAATLGKTTRETELYKLALRGASNEQIKAADSALKVVESQEKMARLSSQLRTGALAAAAAAAAMATAFATALQGSIDLADHLNDLSKSTGISVENLAGLSLLAKQTGTDLDGLAKGINKMSVEMGKSPKEFRALGVTAQDSIGAFKQLSDVFLQIEDVQLRNALANKVFGKSWDELAGALSEGSAGISAAIEKGTRLSGITTEMAQRADEFNDRLEELKIAGSSFGLELLPMLIKIVTEMNSAVTAAGGLVQGLSALASLKMGSWGSDTAEQLRQIDEALLRNQRIREATLGASFTGWILDIRDKALRNMRAVVGAQQAAAAAPELGSHLSPAQDAATEAARIAAAKRAAAAARGFVDEGKKDKDNAAQERKAQLALDIENIRKAGEAQIAAFSNAEKIMEALRSAALVSDRDYYASKQAFIRLNAQASQQALEDEIKRLETENAKSTTTKADRLANLKAITDAQAKLNKVRADSAANATVTSIQEAAALKRLEQSYKDATEAADQYIDTIAKRNERELAGIGQGSRERERQAGLNEIEDRLTATRRRLEGEQRRGEISAETFAIYLGVAQDTYQKEVELYNRRTAAITAAEENWVNGAMEALSNYADEARNVAKQTEELFTNAFQSIEDALVEFTQTGKLNFKSLADSISADITRMSIKQSITGPLAEWMKGAIGEGGALKGMMGILIPGWTPEGRGGGLGGLGGAAGKAAEGTAFTTAVTAAGTGFTAAVTASGAALTAETTAAGLAFTTETSLGGATFAAEVTAAGAAFAASVVAGSATSAAGGLAMASFAEGTSYVPQTGLYQLHQGERVVPASQNSGGRSVVINMPVSFHGPQDQRSVSQGLVRASRMLEREVARGTAG